MNTTSDCQDVMQVCRNGHVITDLLHTYPERGLNHCDRCGAPTLDRCPTCGRELLGAAHVPGLVPVGRLEPPRFCADCGVAFPWSAAAPAPGSDTWTALERLLRRLPRVARQLRVRHGDRPAFRIADDRDVEDLLRALLAVHFDDVRPQCRTPSYSPCTITDFWLAAEATVITGKRARPGVGERELMRQLDDDAAHYARERLPARLVSLIYDPELTLHEPSRFEAAASKPRADLAVHCVIAS